MKCSRCASGPFGFAIRRKQIDCSRRVRVRSTALVAGIDPKSPRLGSAATGIEHRNRRVIGKQMVGGEHVLAQPLMQCFQPPAGATNPSGERRAIKIDAMPRKDLRLPIKRRVIAIFADQHLCEQCRRRQSAGDQPFGRRRLHDLLQARQAYFGREMRTTRSWAGTQSSISLTLSPMRVERAATTAADLAIDIEQNVLARQMIGQWLALGMASRLPL